MVVVIEPQPFRPHSLSSWIWNRSRWDSIFLPTASTALPLYTINNAVGGHHLQVQRLCRQRQRMVQILLIPVANKSSKMIFGLAPTKLSI